MASFDSSSNKGLKATIMDKNRNQSYEKLAEYSQKYKKWVEIAEKSSGVYIQSMKAAQTIICDLNGS